VRIKSQRNHDKDVFACHLDIGVLSASQYLARLPQNDTVINACEYGRTIYDLATARAHHIADDMPVRV